MKVLLETRYLKTYHYNTLIERFKDIEFVFEPHEDCEILVGMYDLIDPHFFDQFKNLKWVLLLSSGFNHLDLKYLKKRGVMVTNAKGIYDIQISEDVVAKILYLNRRMDVYHDQVKSHEWKWRHDVHLYELYKKQVLILGAGSIGQGIAQRLKGFDMEVIGYKRTPEDLPYFDKIITDDEAINAYYHTCDYLVIALPLNRYTEQMINEDVFNKLKKDAVIINIGRGEIIEQNALMNALNEDRLRGAALDVTYPEPLPANHPLWDAKNIFITPHNSSASPMVQPRRMDLITDLFNLYFNEQQLFNIVLNGEEDE